MSAEKKLLFSETYEGSKCLSEVKVLIWATLWMDGYSKMDL